MERLTEKHYLGTDHYMKCSGNCIMLKGADININSSFFNNALNNNIQSYCCRWFKDNLFCLAMQELLDLLSCISN